MKTRIVHLSEYELSGGGKLGESYVHKKHPDLLLKLYPPGRESLGLVEYERACKVFQAGLPCPEPGELVQTEDGRKGILYKRIVGKKSYARALSEHPDRLQEYAADFAKACKILHSLRPEPGLFPSAKEQYKKEMDLNSFLTPEERDGAKRLIDSLAEGDTAVHGDLHHGNVIFTEDGTQYFIDLSDFCTGSPLWDLGIVMLQTCWLPEQVEEELYHIDLATSTAFWKAFVKAYFGEESSLEQVQEMLRPYAFLRILINERVVGSPLEKIRPALHELLGI